MNTPVLDIYEGIPRNLRRKRRGNTFNEYHLLLSIAVGIFFFFVAFGAFASPIEKMVGLEGDAVRGNDYYCKHIAEYQVSEEDRAAITEYCNSIN